MKGTSFISSLCLLAIWLVSGSGLLLERHVCHKKGEQTLRIAMHTHHHCGVETNPCCSDQGEEVLKDACCEHHQFLMLGEEAPVSHSPTPQHFFFFQWTTPLFSFDVQRQFLSNGAVTLEKNHSPPEHLTPTLPALSVFRI
jgi:hypothetical protein